ncbi:MAG: carbohydrate ABC transporter permease [Jatrophihabitantaceae bacterium]
MVSTRAQTTPVTSSRASRARNRRRRETIAGWLFVAPDVLGLIAFVGVPMVLALGVSLYNVDGFGNYTFVGLDNFRHMAGDSALWNSVRVSLIYLVVFVPVTFVLGLGLALLVRDHFPGVGTVRTLFFLPNVLSLVVIGLLWQFMLVDRQGVLTHAARPLGLGKVSWLGDPKYALWTYIAISVWYTMGYQMLLFLAGLKDIDGEYLEAARVDGASPWERFRYVIWPLLRPTSFFVAVTSIVGAVTGLQAFDLVYVLTKGGPDNRTSTVVFYIYEQAFQFGNYGYAAAMTALLVAFLVVVTGVMFAVTKGGRFHAD